jgi:hypothetical protein
MPAGAPSNHGTGQHRSCDYVRTFIANSTAAAAAASALACARRGPFTVCPGFNPIDPGGVTLAMRLMAVPGGLVPWSPQQGGGGAKARPAGAHSTMAPAVSAPAMRVRARFERSFVVVS